MRVLWISMILLDVFHASRPPSEMDVLAVDDAKSLIEMNGKGYLKKQTAASGSYAHMAGQTEARPAGQAQIGRAEYGDDTSTVNFEAGGKDAQPSGSLKADLQRDGRMIEEANVKDLIPAGRKTWDDSTGYATALDQYIKDLDKLGKGMSKLYDTLIKEGQKNLPPMKVSVDHTH